MTDNTMLTIIDKAANSKDVDVQKMQQLLDMQMTIMSKNAEISFNQAMTRLQPKLPAIKKDSKIRHGDKLISTYAKYEDIDRVIRPLYTSEGFSVSFNSKKAADGSVTYYGTLAHVDGHSKTAEMDLPPDSGGAKNKVQERGSTLTYAQRYLVGMLFNLVFTDMDDDANKANEPVTDEQEAEIEKLLIDSDSDKTRFLKFMKVNEVADIKMVDYQKAVTMLKAKMKK